jgi:hypothetical protein
VVRIADARGVRVGDFADVKIVGSSAYDLAGRLV